MRSRSLNRIFKSSIFYQSIVICMLAGFNSVSFAQSDEIELDTEAIDESSDFGDEGVERLLPEGDDADLMQPEEVGEIPDDIPDDRLDQFDGESESMGEDFSDIPEQERLAEPEQPEPVTSEDLVLNRPKSVFGNLPVETFNVEANPRRWD